MKASSFLKIGVNKIVGNVALKNTYVYYIHRGLVSEVFEDDEIEEDETPLEPLFTFFLAEQSDLIRGL